MVQVVQSVAPVGRKMRNPTHTFQLRTRPFQIQPFMIAPVLPGETMKNLLMQSRVVTDPIRNPLIGWWKEYMFFYVKLRDLTGRDDFVQMLLDANKSMASYLTAAQVDTYHAANGIDWTQLCLNRVVEEFFRDEGEALGTDMDGLPLASAYGKKSNWMDSLTPGANMIADVDPNDTSQQAYEAQLNTYEFMRAQKMTVLSYDQWLSETFGVGAMEEPHRPEIIRFVREWSYPSNTVDPTNGVPASAVSWSIQERADKDRFFKEHGFLFGVTVTRPKVYMSKQTGSLVDFMSDAFSWLPAIMRDEPETSLKKFATGTGPIPSITDAAGYWVDIRDLLLYGDQFVNFALTETNAGLVALPTVAGARKYPVSADLDALFLGVSPANKVREDGIVRLGILGTQVETT